MTDQQHAERRLLLAIDAEFLQLRVQRVALRAAFARTLDSLTRDIEAIDQDRLRLAEVLRDVEGDEEILE
jgi:hypothetical protein